MTMFSLFKFTDTVLFPPIVDAETNLAERLGYTKNSKLLIIHADDAGLSHSENAATIRAFEENSINSASIMIPCPWFQEIASYAKSNPKLDFGIHLTLTSEWKNYKWGGVLPAKEIPSLVNNNGFFYAKVKEVIEHANYNEVEKELKAQINRALAFGIQPTHIDTHMACLFATAELFEIYINLGKTYNLPLFIPMNVVKDYPQLVKKIDDFQIPIANYSMVLQDMPKEEWNAFYIKILKQLRPGVTQLLVHPAYDDREMQAIAIDHPSFGATWRQNDFNTLQSAEFKDTLIENNIKLVTWREIKRLMIAPV